MAYELCRAGPCHAEANAIINAARGSGGILDSAMYIAGEYSENRTGLSDSYPCKSCQKIIINAGINRIIIRKADNSIENIIVKDWITEASLSEDKDIKGYY
jgi:dCMP deaminase